MHKKLLVKLAGQLDSFDVLRAKELQYLDYIKACDSFVVEQGDVIVGKDTLINNYQRQLSIMSDIEDQRMRQLKANTDYIKKLEKQNKGHRLRNKIILIGGGVVVTGLVTGLIISLVK